MQHRIFLRHALLTQTNVTLHDPRHTCNMTLHLTEHVHECLPTYNYFCWRVSEVKVALIGHYRAS